MKNSSHNMKITFANKEVKNPILRVLALIFMICMIPFVIILFVLILILFILGIIPITCTYKNGTKEKFRIWHLIKFIKNNSY